MFLVYFTKNNLVYKKHYWNFIYKIPKNSEHIFSKNAHTILISFHKPYKEIITMEFSPKLSDNIKLS